MSEKSKISDVGNPPLAFHRRQMDALTPSAFKDRQFDEAKQLVVDLLHGKEMNVVPTVEPIEFSAANTDAQELYIKKEN